MFYPSDIMNNYELTVQALWDKKCIILFYFFFGCVALCYKFTCDYVNTLQYPTKQVIYLKSVTLGIQPSPNPLKTVFSKGNVFRSAERSLHIQLAWHAFEKVPLNGNDCEDNY